ncbi:methyltransferase domain-containing protein [Rhizosaccharibacter radicis]|uniref:Class I SAM-dependent methyltransferase n=1 Tax=Rhizosaccharibacter radicis TaxID=2782605 RepID=A0ABT1VXA7_9PROT|nr:class I SAM-dependent methyltransferase [Acetobacteraceae bacterium KSS12]
MLDDPQPLADFYRSRRGRGATRLIRRQMRQIWPDVSRQTVVGIGFAAPFLPIWRGEAQRCVEAVTAYGNERDVAGRPRCLVHEDELPFDEVSIDRILLSHALEVAEQPARLLRAVWRALRDDGRLMVMVPHRIGFWAHNEGTPFGDGAPLSARRLERTLQRAMFRPEQKRGALFLPPLPAPLVRLGEALEPAGRVVLRSFPGVLLVEAVKDVYAALPAEAEPRRRMLSPLPAAVPLQAAISPSGLERAAPEAGLGATAAPDRSPIR